ncbi:MAG: hypothetical protein K1X28_01725 [Parachlamydiales bacterium]|nr:hypothetical protein [Parachlamydiales bacterium]
MKRLPLPKLFGVKTKRIRKIHAITETGIRIKVIGLVAALAVLLAME